MADWGGKVAAWFAGVAAVSAALAALVAQTAKQPLHGRPYDLFVVLVIIAIVSFVALLLTGLRALWVAWRNQQRPDPAPHAGPTPDPADWIAGCDETEDHHLLFTLRHRFDNRAAIMAFGEFRCTVTDPGARTTAATGTQLFYQYIPFFFHGAPPVQSGVYRFTWEGRDEKGTWQDIVSGTHEVQLPPLMVRLREPPVWENWKYVGLIGAFHLAITNTTGRRILIASLGFTTDNRGQQPVDSTATMEELTGLKREVWTRQESRFYGPSWRIHQEVPAHQSVSGWFITHVSRDPRGGTPKCTIIVQDDIGNEYPLVIEAQEPATH